MRTIVIEMNLDTVLIWAIVGLVAGFLASRVMLGHGMGVIGDAVVGIIGAVIGGLLANYLGVHLTVAGHPVISEIIVAFVGALILLLIFRLAGFGRGSRRGRMA